MMIATCLVSEEQVILRHAAMRFIRSECPIGVVRRLAEGNDAGRSHYHKEAAKLGWFGMLIPEVYGGSTLSNNALRDLALVGWERGRQLQPGPFVPLNAVAFTLVSEGTEEQRISLLPGIAAGEQVATHSLADGVDSGESGPCVRVGVRGEGLVLTGTQALVQDADIADWFLVTAVSEAGPTQLLIPSRTAGLSLTAMGTLDLTRKLFQLTFQDVVTPNQSVVGKAFEAADAIERRLQIALTLSMAESVGAMARDLEMAVEYARVRIAFGRPIGSFQSIKHLLANTALMVECGEALMLACADSVGEGRDDASEVVSLAKAFISECCIEVAQNCLQVFGGIGYTWEHDHHLYMRRLATDAVTLGDSFWHRERICQLRGL